MKTNHYSGFLFAIILSLILIQPASAQPPQSIAFQAVARDASNNIIANQNIGLRFTIHDLTPGGLTVYRETQNTTTSNVGLFSVSIGSGTVVSGNFSTINWSAGNKYIQIDMDPTGGAAYVTMGTQQFFSVPYSLYSGGSSGNWSILGNSNIVDGTNFFGTTNNIPITFKVFNQNAGRIENTTANTFLGYQSGNVNTSVGTTGFGHHVLLKNTVGEKNVAIGDGAMAENVGGSYSVAVGFQSQQYANSVATATNMWNTSIGTWALRGSGNPANNTGIFNCAVGSQCMWSNSSGGHNTAVGVLALSSNTSGNFNSAFGYEALRDNTTGGSNSAYGIYSMVQCTSGIRNTAMGEESLIALQDGNDNCGVGTSALRTVVSSDYNTGIGSFAGGTSFSHGNLNTFLGRTTSANGSSYVNTTAIGANASVTASNMVRVGNAVTSIGGPVAWTTVSDSRFKKNVQENVHGLDFILKLKPVTYNLDYSVINRMSGKENILSENEKAKEDILNAIAEVEKISFSGFIAQEVESVAKTIGYNFSGVDAPKNDKDSYGLRYSEFVVPLVKAIQEQQVIIEEMKSQNEKLQTENAVFKSDIEKIKAQLGMDLKVLK